MQGVPSSNLGAPTSLSDHPFSSAWTPSWTPLIKDGGARDLIEEAIAEAKREARAKGLSDSEIDAELRAWRTE